jgi:5-carboxymethyl-2-hydroxymuconate isomerase
MSHLTLEYSGNLRAEGRFGVLCRELSQFMSALRVNGGSVFPPGGVRVRAIALEDYCIADGSLADAGFVHATLKIGAGRSDAAKQATCNGLFEIMKVHFAEQFANQGLALSLELYEFSESGTLKHNNLHARIKRANVADPD